MGKPGLFITQPIDPLVLTRLQERLQLEVQQETISPIGRTALLEGVRRNDYLFVRLGDVVNGEVMDANPDLKLIATMATTAAQVDLEAATRRSLPVIARIPAAKDGSSADSIIEESADLAFGLMICAARRLIEGDRLMRKGIFPGAQSPHLMGSNVNGKTLGIVGLGRIGRAMARRARGFGMRIIYSSRTRHPQAEAELSLEFHSLSDLLNQADFVSLHVAYNKETHHYFSDDEFGAMKPNAYLINTSRGPVVKTGALVKALLRRQIAGAALDVYEGEPFPTLPQALLEAPNVVLSPHLGSAVKEKRLVMAQSVAESILAFLDGEIKGNLLNPEVLT